MKEKDIETKEFDLFTCDCGREIDISHIGVEERIECPKCGEFLVPILAEV